MRDEAYTAGHKTQIAQGEEGREGVRYGQNITHRPLLVVAVVPEHTAEVGGAPHSFGGEYRDLVPLQ